MITCLQFFTWESLSKPFFATVNGWGVDRRCFGLEILLRLRLYIHNFAYNIGVWPSFQQRTCRYLLECRVKDVWEISDLGISFPRVMSACLSLQSAVFFVKFTQRCPGSPKSRQVIRMCFPWKVVLYQSRTIHIRYSDLHLPTCSIYLIRYYEIGSPSVSAFLLQLWQCFLWYIDLIRFTIQLVVICKWPWWICI